MLIAHVILVALLASAALFVSVETLGIWVVLYYALSLLHIAFNRSPEFWVAEFAALLLVLFLRLAWGEPTEDTDSNIAKGPIHKASFEQMNCNVVSSGPPERSLTEILSKPTKLKLKKPRSKKAAS